MCVAMRAGIESRTQAANGYPYGGEVLRRGIKSLMIEALAYVRASCLLGCQSVDPIDGST